MWAALLLWLVPTPPSVNCYEWINSQPTLVYAEQKVKCHRYLSRLIKVREVVPIKGRWYSIYEPWPMP